MALEIIPVNNRRQLAVFTRIPGRISAYREIKGILPDRADNYDPAVNPVQRHIEGKLFIAYRDGDPVGRIAAITDFLHPERETGLFGCFECENDNEAASSLVDAAGGWLKKTGRAKMIGPATFNTNQQVGVLIEGNEHPPQIMLPYNPPYYGALLEQAGLSKEADLLSFSWSKETGIPPKLTALVQRVKRNTAVSVRRLNLSCIAREAQLVRNVFNGSMRENWGFTPLTTAEAASMLTFCRRYADCDLIAAVEVSSKPAGIIIFLPTAMPGAGADRSVRVAILGVLPEFRFKGLDLYMIEYLTGICLKKGYQSADISMVHEDNRVMLKIITKLMGAKQTRRYRVYSAPLRTTGE